MDSKHRPEPLRSEGEPSGAAPQHVIERWGYSGQPSEHLTDKQIIADIVACAESWEPGVRLLGDIRTVDIARVLRAVLEPSGAAESRLRDAERLLRRLRAQLRYDPATRLWSVSDLEWFAVPYTACDPAEAIDALAGAAESRASAPVTTCPHCGSEIGAEFAAIHRAESPSPVEPTKEER